MAQLYERRTHFECLMQWVLVVYEKELKQRKLEQARSKNQMKAPFTRSMIKTFVT